MNNDPIPNAEKIWDARPPSQPSIIDEMITGLQNKLPADARVLPPNREKLNTDQLKPTLETYMQKIEEMNEKLRATFEEKLKELETKIDLPGKTENPTSVSPEQAAEALKVIVSEFNEKLSTWYQDTGCVINFGWSYNPQKFLEILGIDYIVYRKEPPSEKTLKQALAQQPTS